MTLPCLNDAIWPQSSRHRWFPARIEDVRAVLQHQQVLGAGVDAIDETSAHAHQLRVVRAGQRLLRGDVRPRRTLRPAHASHQRVPHHGAVVAERREARHLDLVARSDRLVRQRLEDLDAATRRVADEQGPRPCIVTTPRMRARPCDVELGSNCMSPAIDCTGAENGSPGAGRSTATCASDGRVDLESEELALLIEDAAAHALDADRRVDQVAWAGCL